MDCPNPEVYVEMMRRFSTTLNKVLLAYADMVQKDFAKFVASEKLACILMNNVQQLRQKHAIRQIFNMNSLLQGSIGENLREYGWRRGEA